MQIPSPIELLNIFSADIGLLSEVAEARVPEPYRTLLVHTEHMTVAMESHHGTDVSVDVLQVLSEESHYAREILLRRKSDGQVVQYGIVRINLECLPQPVREQILSQQLPLGRILISNGLFRHVELGSIWSIDINDTFRARCETDAERSYGRTALIHLNNSPAIELLEVVVERYQRKHES